MQKARLPSPTHSSHQRHRRELWTRILLPMLAAVAVIVALATLTSIAAFRPGSEEVARWAAVSTIWIILPIMTTALLLLVILIALIYGMARLLAIIPAYTGQAQNIAWRIEETVKRLADKAAKPIFALEGITATIKRLVGMK